METWIPWISGLLPLVLASLIFVISWRCVTLADKALALPGSEVKVRMTKGSVEIAVKRTDEATRPPQEIGSSAASAQLGPPRLSD